jgi:uncharacterized protein involved in exopolysaccharide biosynthesis
MTNPESSPTQSAAHVERTGTGADRENEIGLLDLLIVIAKHKKMILSLTACGAALAVLVSLLLPNVYTATTTILPPQQSQSMAASMLGQLGGITGLAGGAFGIKNPNDLYVGMLGSRTIGDALITRFDLKSVYKTEFLEDARRALRAASNIASGRDGIIVVEVSDREPQRAADIANAYAQELDRLTQTLAVTEASQRRLFMEKQLKTAKDDLAEAEVRLRETQEKTGLIQLDGQAQAIITAAAQLKAAIAAKEVELGAMRAFATEKNPDYMRTQQELNGLRSQLTKLEIGKGAAGQGDIFIPTGSVPEAGLEYVRRFRDVKYYETIFELLAKQFEIAKMDEGKDAATVQVLDPALVPEKRSAPRRSLIVNVVTSVSFAVAVFLAFALEARNRARNNALQARKLSVLKKHFWSF